LWQCCLKTEVWVSDILFLGSQIYSHIYVNNGLKEDSLHTVKYTLYFEYHDHISINTVCAAAMLHLKEQTDVLNDPFDPDSCNIYE
jgi:hypothetical protein